MMMNTFMGIVAQRKRGCLGSIKKSILLHLTQKRNYWKNGEGIYQSHYKPVEIPENISLTKYILGSSLQSMYADDIALSHDDKSFTYNQVNQHVYKVAQALQTDYWVKKNDKILIIMPNCIEFAIAKLATMESGAIAAAVNPACSVSDIAHYLDQLEATHVVLDKSCYDKFLEGLQLSKRKSLKYIIVTDAEASDVGSVQGFGGLDVANKDVVELKTLFVNDGLNCEDRFHNKDDVALLPFSSGTTGMPKGVKISHYNLIANIIQMDNEEINHMYRGQRAIGAVPLWHCYGSQCLLNTGLRKGIKISLLTEFNPEKFLSIIQNEKIQKAHLVPPILLFMAKYPMVNNHNLSSLVDVACAAAPLSKTLSEELFKQNPSMKIKQYYGLSELSAICHTDTPRDIVLGSCGVLVPNTEMKLLDVNGETIMEDGQEGEVCIRGPQVMVGYLNNEEATRATMTDDGFLKTGDLGHVKDGHLTLTDRIKELIKVKGFQVAPAELEAILLQHPSISDSCVVQKVDERAGELPVAFVVLKSGVDETSIKDADIMEFVNKDIPKYKHIVEVKYIDKIPKSASGKILRRLLRDQCKQLN